jgi:hypothetical protein
MEMELVSSCNASLAVSFTSVTVPLPCSSCTVSDTELKISLIVKFLQSHNVREDLVCKMEHSSGERIQGLGILNLAQP